LTILNKNHPIKKGYIWASAHTFSHDLHRLKYRSTYTAKNIKEVFLMFGYGYGCGYPAHGFGFGRGFALIVVLFILLIIVGCACWR
jgi:uncharacterized protein (TIGR01732 family)